MKGTDHFKRTIYMYLEQRAEEDALFAKKYRNPAKNMDECVTHILNSQVMTKSVLLDEISNDSPDGVESSLKVHVSNLRRKLREAGEEDYIESVWGIGFKMREETS